MNYDGGFDLYPGWIMAFQIMMIAFTAITLVAIFCGGFDDQLGRR